MLTQDENKLIVQVIKDKIKNYEILIRQETSLPNGQRDLALLDNLTEGYHQYNQILDKLQIAGCC
ncbi:hypothetical protein [Melissococcus plutonius]|uniref:hypothetical protein n=1 Tax=Melissococcus plutonius TaxID=33970 RepID=UPI003C2C632F